MLTYLLLSGPGLVGRDPAGLDRLIRETAPDVLLQVGEPVLWTDQTGGCLLWTWESAAETFGGNHVHADPRGVLALAGSAWSRGSWETVGSLAQADGWPSDPAELRDALTGSFSAVSISVSGRGFVTTDATGTGHVYLARGPAIWATSNRAPLAAIGLDGHWEPDVEAQAWMAMHAFFATPATSVKGVELLPASAALTLAPGTLPQLVVGTTPWEVGAFSTPSLSDALDDAAHALTELASAVASTTAGTPVVSLSGGKDSRLVLAAFRAAGRASDVQFRTTGKPGASDREAATLLGVEYGLDLEVHDPGPGTGPTLPELDQRVRRHAFQTAGMLGAWDLQGVYGNSSEITLTGMYGELMRTIYRFDGPLDTPDQAIDHVLYKMAWNRQRILQPKVHEALNEQLESWARGRLAQGWTPRSLLDLFYAEMRIARWLGTAAEVHLNAVANLLQLKECLIAGFAAAPEARSRDELHYRLIERLDPSLLTMPLANAHWDSALAPPGSAKNPTPIVATFEGPEAWQIQGWRSHRRLIGAELLADDNALHGILDPARIRRVVSREASPRRAAQLWAIWAGSIWVSGGYEIYPWNGAPTPPTIPPSRLVAALSLPPQQEATDGSRQRSSAPVAPRRSDSGQGSAGPNAAAVTRALGGLALLFAA